MIEAESKYWSPGNASVAEALTKLGAKKLSEQTMEDVYFSHPSKDFAKSDEAIRLRKKPSGAELTYKGPRMKTSPVKAREEISLGVDDPLNAQRVLERLGFREVYSVTKRRATYLLDKLRVEIDAVEGLGDFVELELLTESPDKASTLLELARKELGLTRLEPRTYLEMIIEKKGR